MNYRGAFALPGGELRTKEYSSNAHQFSIDNSSQVTCMSLSFSEISNKRVGAQLWRSVGADEVDYEWHLGTNLDCILSFSTKQRRHSEKTLWKNQGELQRTQMLFVCNVSNENTKLAGYMLPGDRSMVLDTDGSLAWLYPSPKVLSPRRVLDKCFDWILISFEQTAKVIEPITRQTFDFASEIACLGNYTNFNLISRMTTLGINFYLIPCLLLKLC